MIKNTPCHWSVVDGHYPSFKEINGPSFKITAVMWANDLTEDDYRKRNSDLNLIAAAPELLEALERLFYAIEGDDDFDIYTAKQIALEAIAKAKGE